MTQQNITTAQVIEYLQACHQEGRTIHFYAPRPFYHPDATMQRLFQTVHVYYPEFEPLEHDIDTETGEPIYLTPQVGFRFESNHQVRFRGVENVEENIALLADSTFDLYCHRLNDGTTYPETITPITRDTVRTVYLERVKEENERHRKAMDAINKWCNDTLPKFAE